MNTLQLHRIQYSQGFIAALDQSGGSTPAALIAYGVEGDSYDGEEAMYDLVHAMRTRIITNTAFDSRYILGAILFAHTMRGQIEGYNTADYLWEQKGIVPFLKIDNGLDELADGVQLMRPIPELSELLDEAKEMHIFGTKMRSLISQNNTQGIVRLVDQQFELAEQIIAAGFVPIIEPEVAINAPEKPSIEAFLRDELLAKLDTLSPNQSVMLKVTIPDVDDAYLPLIEHPNVLRVVALSGGYTGKDANEKLARNHGLIASFSRALSENLRLQLSDDEFTATLEDTIRGIYEASTT